MKKIFVILIHCLAIFITVVLLIFHELVLYGIMQGKGQLGIIINSRPIQEVLSDESTADSIKRKILLVEQIKKFAFDSLGINPTENYNTYYQQQGALLWVITACEPFSFTPKQWYFPVVGAVTYKGFFDYKVGLKEADELRLQGYDVDYSEVNAWSTLGWFHDPILSSMLNKDVGSVANLFIHELTHGTLYVKDNVQFNENLASFIGEKGALLFLKRTYGENAVEYKSFVDRLYDNNLYVNYILGATENLSMLYQSIKDSSEGYKMEIKDRTIRAIISGINMLQFKDQQRFSRLGKSIIKLKNAYFFDYLRYDSQKYFFENELNQKFGGDIKKYITYLKGKYPDV